ncbi:MAG: 50S ribosomal protein L3 [Thermoplasmata archaeon]
MGSPNKPQRGSHAHWPRKRAASPVAKFNSWPEVEGAPRLQGFAGYKAGMTHVLLVDYRKDSMTAGQEVMVPVTVLEVPPMKVAAVRTYEKTPYGLKSATEVWANELDKELARRAPVKKKKTEKKLTADGVADVRVIAYTQPVLVTGIPKKKPEIMEIRVGGSDIKKRLEYAMSLLGKEVKIENFTSPGEMVDVAAVTKGKGFQGVIKRFGVKLLTHKNSKHRRLIGTLGPHYPSYVTKNIPQAGQLGYHQRTEYNKRILKIGNKPEDVNPEGGFLHYGVIRNPYVVIHGSVPGPVKRLIRLRDPVRWSGEKVDVNINYLSKESMQGA